MSCNLFSDFGGTNIRSQRWTKSSLPPTATAYQKHWEPSKKAEIAWLDARWHPTFLERQGLIWLVPIKKQFLTRTFAVARDSITKFRNLGGSLQESRIRKLHHLKRHLTNYLQKTRKLRVHATRPFHWFKTTKTSRTGKPTIHNIISNWNSAIQQFLRKETEMSCNLCSDLGGTNIRSHGLTKSSLRPTATAYQKHWEPSKKAEIAWLDARWHPTFLERQGLIWLVPIKKQFLSRTFAVARDSITKFRNLGGKSSGV